MLDKQLKNVLVSINHKEENGQPHQANFNDAAVFHKTKMLFLSPYVFHMNIDIYHIKFLFPFLSVKPRF